MYAYNLANFWKISMNFACNISGDHYLSIAHAKSWLGFLFNDFIFWVGSDRKRWAWLLHWFRCQRVGGPEPSQKVCALGWPVGPTLLTRKSGFEIFRPHPSVRLHSVINRNIKRKNKKHNIAHKIDSQVKRKFYDIIN